MNWYKKSYNTQVGMLNRYLRQGFNPYDYISYLMDFLEERYPKVIDSLYKAQEMNKNNLFNEKELYYDDEDFIMEKWIEVATPQQVGEFKEWIGNKNLDASRDMAPPYEAMDYNKFIKPTWLVHFTNNPHDISSEGFVKGWEEMEGLSYTTFYRNHPYPGYNFAFQADNYRDIRAAARANKYGKHAVLFWGSGVEATHYGDNEDQIIVWGPSINTNLIIPITHESDGNWAIMNNRYKYDEKPMYESEDITDVIDWAINNNELARRVMHKF